MHESSDGFDGVVVVPARRGDAPLPHDLARVVHHDRGDLGAAEVDADSAHGCPSTRTCSSLSCFASTVDGAPAMRSTACAVLGNAITSRIDAPPHMIETMRSRPKAMPPCGGVPYSRASRKNPNRAFASSSEMPSR